MTDKEKIKELERRLEYKYSIEEILKDLEDCMTDKIQELHTQKWFQTERHAFIYYRSLIWQIKDQLKYQKI